MIHHLLFCLPGRSALRRLGPVLLAVLLATLGFTPPGFAQNGTDLQMYYPHITDTGPQHRPWNDRNRDRKIAQGRTITVNMNVRITGSTFIHIFNPGRLVIATPTLRLYLSDDSTITTDDTEIKNVIPERRNNTLYYASTTVQMNSVGAFWFGVCVDPVAGETITSNNCSTGRQIVVGLPDLGVYEVGLDHAERFLKAGESNSPVLKVRNVGTAPSVPSTVRIHRLTRTTFDATATEISTFQVGAIPAGGTSPGYETTVSFPESGKFFYGICVDAITEDPLVHRNEFRTDNNCFVATYQAIYVDDVSPLTVDDVSVSSATPEAGTTFTINATVRNPSDETAAPTTLRYFRSTDSTIGFNDTELATDAVGALVPDGSSQESAEVSIPNHGTYWVGACAAPVQGEVSTANNCSTGVPITVTSPPDLVVRRVTFSDTKPGVGATFTINTIVQNVGGLASAPTTLSYYSSTLTTVVSTANTELASSNIRGLAPGESSQESVTVSIADPERYWVGACAGPVDDESDTSNNCSPDGQLVTVVGQLDLRVHNLIIKGIGHQYRGPSGQRNHDRTPKVARGRTIWIDAGIVERGHTGLRTATLRFYFSDDSTITTADTEFASVTARPVNTGYLSGGTDVQLNSAGAVWIGACADPVRSESDYSNNCSIGKQILVGLPDLAVYRAGLSNAKQFLKTGESVYPDADVWNIGAAPSVPTTLRFYRSTDGTFDATDTEVATFPVGALAPGEKSRLYEATVPFPEPGTFYVGFCVDAITEDPAELKTDDNCNSYGPFTVTGSPDLIVDGAGVSDATPEAGAAFTINATVRNSGHEAAAATTLRYYRSNDATITTDDSELATDPISALLADGSSSENAAVSIADIGNYWVGACVDTVAGEVTTNNCSAGVAVSVTAPPVVVPTLPDLTVDNASVSNAMPGPGIPFTINARVQNPGNEAAAATTLFYYRSTDATITADDTQIATDPVDALAINGSSQESAEVSIANTGRYWIGACAGPVDGEVATGNNCSTGIAVTVTAPDLRVDNVSASNTTPGAGVPFTIVARVRNQSAGGATATTLRYVRSTDSTITADDTEIATDPVGALTANASSQQNTEVSIADAGVYWVGACANPVNGEAATANNCSTGVQVTVAGPPDLIVDDAAVSDPTPEPGATFTIEATVRNQGADVSLTTRLRYYRSTDATITIGDNQIATDTISALAINGSSQESAEVSIADAGVYWVGACVDTVSGEVAENNNCSDGVQVTVAGPPDLIVRGITVSDFTPEPGASFTINARVRNRGDGAAAATTLRYYLSADNRIRTTDNELTTDAVGELAAAAISDQSAVVSIAEAGEYWIGACIDAVAGEVARTNCTRGPRVSVTAPDMTVDGVSVSESSGVRGAESSGVRGAESSVQAGASFTISATARNSGNGASAATTLRYYRSADDTITTDDSELATDPINALAAGGSSQESATVSIADAGQYWVGACIDPVANEVARANCSSSVQVSVTAPPSNSAPPDLVIRRVTVSDATPEAGAAFTINARTRNRGNGAAAATTLRYYLSADNAIRTTDNELATDPVESLAPDAISDQSAVVSIADAGEYWIGACIDAVVGEVVRTNCSRGPQVSVTAAPVTAPPSNSAPPDLVIRRITVSDATPEAGAAFTINVRARNRGDGAAAATTLRYYLSADNRIRTTDNELATDPVEGLAPAATLDQSAVVSITDAGEYWIGACIDPVVGEVVRTNCWRGPKISVAVPDDGVSGAALEHILKLLLEEP